jgi:hypothetical protein
MERVTVVRQARPWAASLIALGLGLGVASAAEAVRPSDPKVAPPKEISVFVGRRTGCNHWMGEDAYDAARSREIAAAIRKLGCDQLDAEEVRLRARHRDAPEVHKALDQARDAEG